ncbi:hypothetical protein EN829_041395 [Mesorhizobium sp. M00.F.Ca.ET.186.01.1.1]|nr:hypothetical protein EN829_041395 [Mesorhizobium sp. M00.F.Ca.ET.186.01.1.1]
MPRSMKLIPKLRRRSCSPKASDLRDELKQLGIMLNKEAKADSLVQDLDKQVESTKKRIGHIVGKDKTVTVFDGGAVKTLILSSNAFTGRTIHGELGLPMTENAKRDIDPKVGWLQISSEVIGKYASDYIFMAVDAKAESLITRMIHSGTPWMPSNKTICTKLTVTASISLIRFLLWGN